MTTPVRGTIGVSEDDAVPMPEYAWAWEEFGPGSTDAYIRDRLARMIVDVVAPRDRDRLDWSTYEVEITRRPDGSAYAHGATEFRP